MKIELISPVIIANDYPKLVEWYRTSFDLETIMEESKNYHYSELGWEGKSLIGIAMATEMKHKTTEPRNNSCMLQWNVSDIEHIIKSASDNGAKVWPIQKDETHGFKFSGFHDIEGNEVWIVGMLKDD